MSSFTDDVYFKRVQQMPYWVQVVAIILAFGGFFGFLWRASQTTWADTAITGFSFFFWQLTSTLFIRFSAGKKKKEKARSARAELMGEAVQEINQLKSKGNFLSIIAWCAGFTVTYLIFRGVMMGAFHTIFTDMWLSIFAGCLIGSVVLAPFFFMDLHKAVDSRLGSESDE